MSEAIGVMGYFADADALHDAIEHATRAHVPPPTAYLPIADAPAVDTLYPGSSPVRWYALTGGLFGIAAALTMTIWMSWDYPLVLGGKPITSLPPFLVAAFELMILFGAIGAFIGVLRIAHLPDLTPSQAYRSELVVDRYALYIPCADDDQRNYAVRTLRDAGATDIEDIFLTERGRLAVTE